ncbi:uroporphyrinogen-III synthase [Sanguibacter suarezii]|uniref:uroporphyrinogen-III synthase n=1 Tax=Sanguibacter suarezii TaxID=60921 RepID=UPI000831B3E6|nr:uroporphyrinogen-III synthase [Sanguibacter suarezii]
MTSTPPGALAGLHVLIPRAPGRGAGLARLIEAAGGVPVVAPLISRQAIDDAERAALDDAVAGLRDGAFAWVAVTSVNAVDELVASAERVETSPTSRPASPPAAPSRPTEPDAADAGTSPLGRLATAARWAVVGPATARALAAHGITADLVAPQNSATGMLAVWPAATAAAKPGPRAATPTSATSSDAPRVVLPRVLLPLGDLARPTLERGLTALGYTPVRVTAYRTVSHPAPADVVTRWRAGGFDAVVLTSGSVAREVDAQLGSRPGVLAVAIGEPTREAALAVGQPVAAVADAATDDALFAALLAAVAAGTGRAHPVARPAASGGPAPAPAALLDPRDDAAIIEERAHPATRTPGAPHTPEEP